MSYVTFPMVTCPHCDKEFQMDDYYDIKSGDTRICHLCEKEIHVSEVEQVLTARFTKEPAR